MNVAALRALQQLTGQRLRPNQEERRADASWELNTILHVSSSWRCTDCGFRRRQRG
jgi:hypothetical protein